MTYDVYEIVDGVYIRRAHCQIHPVALTVALKIRRATGHRTHIEIVD